MTTSASMSASSCLERSAGGPATRRLTLVLMLSRKSTYDSSVRPLNSITVRMRSLRWRSTS